MWLVYGLIASFLISLVVYIDEHLATHNKLPDNATIHTKVGSVLLMSTLMAFVGAGILFFWKGNVIIPDTALALSLLSAIQMVGMFMAYFYLLQKYPVHQVSPLFQFSSIWLLIFGLLYGEVITVSGLFGIIVLMYGVYILDAGTFRWKIPTKLLSIVIPATTTSAVAVFMVRIASETADPVIISFWQLLGIGIIGVILFIFVKRYREAFIYRIKNQGKKFLGLSLANEALAESSIIFSNLSVAVAPVAAYVAALSGVDSLILLVLLALFPQSERTKVTKTQWVAVGLIVIGVVLLDLH